MPLTKRRWNYTADPRGKSNTRCKSEILRCILAEWEPRRFKSLRVYNVECTFPDFATSALQRHDATPLQFVDDNEHNRPPRQTGVDVFVVSLQWKLVPFARQFTLAFRGVSPLAKKAAYVRLAGGNKRIYNSRVEFQKLRYALRLYSFLFFIYESRIRVSRTLL